MAIAYDRWNPPTCRRESAIFVVTKGKRIEHGVVGGVVVVLVHVVVLKSIEIDIDKETTTVDRHRQREGNDRNDRHDVINDSDRNDRHFPALAFRHPSLFVVCLFVLFLLLFVLFRVLVLHLS